MRKLILILFLFSSVLNAQVIDGAWVETAADLNIGYKDGGADVVWNENTSGTVWQLTAGAAATDYVIYYFLWTNDANNPIKKVIGQHAYPNRSDARDALQSEVGKTPDITLRGSIIKVRLLHN